MKLILLPAALIVAGSTAAMAAETLPAAAVIHQLTADGYDLRSLEAEKGRYDAVIRTAEGKLVKLSVDPMSGRVYSRKAVPASALRDGGPAVPTSAADAIVAAAAEGHYDVQELEFRDGRYVVEARDDAGVKARIDVTAATGQVAQVSHDPR